MRIFTEEFKNAFVTTSAKTFAYTIVFGPIILLVLLAGGLERGLWM